MVLAMGMAAVACSGSGSRTSPFADGGGSTGGGGNSSIGNGGSSGGGGGNSSTGEGGGGSSGGGNSSAGGGGSSSGGGGGSSGGDGGSSDGGFAWVPFGPDDPTDPTPDWPAYNALASHQCGELKGKLDSGEINGNLWQALAAVCAAAVDGHGDQWDAAQAFAGGGETGFTIPCLQEEATAMLQRALAWHQLHPGRQPAVRFQTKAGKTDCGLEQEREQQQEQQQSTETTDQSSETTQQSSETTVSPPESTEQSTETTVQLTETTG